MASGLQKVPWTHPGIARILAALPVDTPSLLDVGCGTGIIGALCRVYRDVDRLVGIDAHGPSLALCRRHAFYDLCVEASLDAGPLPFANREFAVATAVEVIEHLTKSAGLALLAELERVADLVIVTTPCGFMPQGELMSNPLQRHQSGWTPADFTRRGYTVRGVGGFGLFGRQRRFVSSALAPLTYYLPQLSELLLCTLVQDGGGRREDGRKVRED